MDMQTNYKSISPTGNGGGNGGAHSTGASSASPLANGEPRLLEKADRLHARRSLAQVLDEEEPHEPDQKHTAAQQATSSSDPGLLNPEQLVERILGLEDHAFIEHAGAYLRAAARHVSPLALETLLARKLSSPRFQHATFSGWQLKDSPFKAAIDHLCYKNISLLLQLGAVPDATLVAALSAMPQEVQQAFSEYDVAKYSNMFVTDIAPPVHAKGQPRWSNSQREHENFETEGSSGRAPAAPRQRSTIGSRSESATVVLRPKPPMIPAPARPHTKDELENIILFRPDTDLFAGESELIREVAQLPDAEALIKALRNRGVLFLPYSESSRRGWKPEDCPFLAAACRGQLRNLHTLLALNVRPAENSEILQLPSLDPEVKNLFRAYGILM